MRLSLAVAVLLTVLLWYLPNRPRDVAVPGEKLNAVSFAAYRNGQSPLESRFPSAAQVDQDLALLAGRTRAIRTYAAIEGNYDTAALARAHGLKVWQGIWLGSDPAGNAREIAAGIALAKRYPDTVERVVVGNEVLLRGDLPPAALIAALDQVHAAVHQPVTYADVWEFWRKFPQVAAHVDLVTVHFLPYWENIPIGIDRAVAHIGATYDTMARLFPGKRIVIGETGWPSRGRERADAAPGVVNQAVFLSRFLDLARRRGLDYNLIEAFDQHWKYQDEGVVGANWGLFTADRQPKFPLTGPVVEDRLWPVHAAFHLLLAGLLLGFASAWRRPSPFLICAAFALAGGLAFAQASIAPELYDEPRRLAAVVNLGGQAILAAMLMRRLAAGPPATYRTGAQATETMRGLLLLRVPPVDAIVEDLSFVFVWTAAVLQALVVYDPRYREFPLPAFAVPLIVVPLRALARDLPTRGGGREEKWVGLMLALGAITGAVREGAANRESLIWSAAALVLAVPPLLRCYRRGAAPSQAIPATAAPTMPQVILSFTSAIPPAATPMAPSRNERSSNAAPPSTSAASPRSP